MIASAPSPPTFRVLPHVLVSTPNDIGVGVSMRQDP